MKVFPDDISGGVDFMQRVGMVELLQHLEDHSDEKFVVIFDDLKRFSRNIMYYWMLREELKRFDAIVDCPNFKFGTSPEEKFFETIVAASGELERDQNARQVVQKMKARLENGPYEFFMSRLSGLFG